MKRRQLDLGERDSQDQSDQQEHRRNSLPSIDGARIIGYNFNEGERPGGIKVRAKIRISSRRAAGTLDAAQAEAIRELLQWSRQHRSQGRQP
jgi:hypothetical protein